MALHLVRHAKAGTRSDHADDINRPLSSKGLRQAELLAQRLGDRPIERILTSPARRCRETIAPLAAVRGLEPEVHDALWEGWHGPALDLVLALAWSPTDIVLCSHGDIIPGVLGALTHRGLAVGPVVSCAKGSVWTLDTDPTGAPADSPLGAITGARYEPTSVD